MLTSSQCRALSNHLYRAERRAYEAACNTDERREKHVSVTLAHLTEAAAICGFNLVEQQPEKPA